MPATPAVPIPPAPIPPVPTPLVAVEVRTHPEPGPPHVVLVAEPSASDGGLVLGPGAAALGIDEDWLARHEVKATAGSAQRVPAPELDAEPRRADHGWILGTGSGSTQHWRTAGAALVRTVRSALAGRAEAGRPAPDVLQIHLPAGTSAEQAAALTLGCVVASHHYRVTNTDPPARLRAVRLISTAGSDDGQSLARAVNRARILGRATGLARDLANTPSGVKDPEWLTETAARLAAGIPGVRAAVRDEHWLAEHGFGGVLAVGGGSSRPPRLLELGWAPDNAVDGMHLVLVGKGITFDTGGISIKPAEGMHLMRTDMSGGAAVIGATLAIAELALPVRVSALVPCAENHVSGSAYRPGDVVRHVGGTTTEVTNTDAEGRMVLADALAHAVATLAPSVMVDVATLTGSMKVSLGLRTGGLFATEPQLADRIQQAGERVGEAWWPMPLIADHAPDVRSDIADVRQCPPGPGAITAALFLREFTGGLAWAHLDIAGPARADASYDEVNPGGTGFATRTLIELAESFTR